MFVRFNLYNLYYLLWIAFYKNVFITTFTIFFFFIILQTCRICHIKVWEQAWENNKNTLKFNCYKPNKTNIDTSNSVSSHIIYIQCQLRFKPKLYSIYILYYILSIILCIIIINRFNFVNNLLYTVINLSDHRKSYYIFINPKKYLYIVYYINFIIKDTRYNTHYSVLNCLTVFIISLENIYLKEEY